jgi:hypothetical protein
MRRTHAAAAILCLGLSAAAGDAPAQGTPAGPGLDRLEPGQLTADQIRITLGARGYADLGAMRREGDAVLVADARRYGEPTGPLTLDAKTGQVQAEAPLSEAQARALLGDRGFSEVRDLGRDGDAILATADRSGTKVDLKVDLRSGSVSQR